MRHVSAVECVSVAEMWRSCCCRGMQTTSVRPPRTALELEQTFDSFTLNKKCYSELYSTPIFFFLAVLSEWLRGRCLMLSQIWPFRLLGIKQIILCNGKEKKQDCQTCLRTDDIHHTTGRETVQWLRLQHIMNCAPSDFTSLPAASHVK